MVIDPKNIDSARNPEQLSTDWRGYYARFKKAAKKALGNKWEDKTSHFKILFEQLLYGEAIAQKLKAKYIRIMLQTSGAISEKIRSDPKTYYYKLMPQFKEINQILREIINEQAYEIQKARNMRYLANGVLGKVADIEKGTMNEVRRQLVIEGKKDEALKTVRTRQQQRRTGTLP